MLIGRMTLTINPALGSATASGRQRALALWTLALAASVTGLAGYVLFGSITASCALYLAVPIWDQWSFVEDYRSLAEGRSVWSVLWPAASENRIVLPRLFMLADAWLSRMDNKLLTAATVGCLLFIAFYVSFQVLREHSLAPTTRVIAGGLAIAALLSVQQAENLMAGYGL